VTKVVTRSVELAIKDFMLYMFIHSKLFVFFTPQVSDASLLKKISFGDLS